MSTAGIKPTCTIFEPELGLVVGLVVGLLIAVVIGLVIGLLIALVIGLPIGLVATTVGLGKATVVTPLNDPKLDVGLGAAHDPIKLAEIGVGLATATG